VNQAVNAFKRHLPDSSPVNLVTDKDEEGRVTFARGAGSFTVSVKAVSDSAVDTQESAGERPSEPQKTLRRTSLAEFLNRGEGK
jgi:type I site-specific restriction endonuclease